MQVVKENIGNLNEILKITVSSSDYVEVVEKALKEQRKKANIPGFRPGMVPMGIIRKMYLKGVTADETYKMASQECYKYITDNNIETLGDPLPADTQPDIDFEGQGDLEFHFEIGVSPEVKLDLDNTDITKYSINVDDNMLDSYKKNFFQRFGSLVDVEVATKDEAITGTLSQGDVVIDDAYVGLISMNEEERAPFIGKKTGDTMEVNVNELYKSASQRASMLKIKEEQLETIDPIYIFTITQIRKFEVPAISEELIAQALPESDVKTIEQFDAYAINEVKKSLENESKYKLAIDIRGKLLNDAGLTLPDTFLKKWIYAMNEGKFSHEEVEKEYAQFVEMMSWDIIKKKFVVENDMKVTHDELLEEAKAMAKMQFIQYGMPTVEDGLLTNYANQIVSKKEEARKLYDALYERKVVEFVESKVKLSMENISAEDFGKLFQ